MFTLVTIVLLFFGVAVTVEGSDENVETRGNGAERAVTNCKDGRVADKVFLGATDADDNPTRCQV